MSEVSDYHLAFKLQQEFNSEKDLNQENTDDFLLALQIQEKESEQNDVVISKSFKPSNGEIKNNLANQSWELIDPTPDTRGLFVEFDKKYFCGKLAGVEVVWSKRMTMCAGICSYAGHKSGYCSIKLSEPLLKLRPRKNLLETLLHEMIHAYLFVTKNNKDRDGHGPEFKFHMQRINNETGLSITVYHSFHNEVAVYQTHWWKCNGPCQNKHPYYGMVKRSMNRAPSPIDNWWTQHKFQCGGEFIKIKEPANYVNKTRSNKASVQVDKVAGGGLARVKDDRLMGSTAVNTGSIGGTIWGTEKIQKIKSNIHGFGVLDKNKITNISNDLQKKNSKQINTMDKFVSTVVKNTTFSTIVNANNMKASNTTVNNVIGTNTDNRYSNTNDLLKNLHAERMDRLKRKIHQIEDDNETISDKNNLKSEDDKGHSSYEKVNKKTKNGRYYDFNLDSCDVPSVDLTSDKENQEDVSKSCNNASLQDITIKKEFNDSIDLTPSSNQKRSNNYTNLDNSFKNTYKPSLPTVKSYKVSSRSSLSKSGIDWGKLNHGTVFKKSPRNEKDLKNILSDACIPIGSIVKINGFTSVSSGAKLKPAKQLNKKKKLSTPMVSLIKNTATKKDVMNSSSVISKLPTEYSGSIESYVANVSLDNMLSSLKNDDKATSTPSSTALSSPTLSSLIPSSSIIPSSFPSTSSTHPNIPSTLTSISALQSSSVNVNCPICNIKLPVNLINKHLDHSH